jgi:3-isopropylmalate/(R)-2-methylmalate dehydratase small subunit
MSDAITTVTGTAIPVPGDDIDTDRIFPGRFLKLLTFEGVGGCSFAEERAQWAARGRVHPLDDPRHADATIMLVNKNFGCGSSREHAVQALKRWNHGIRAFVGESFSSIFFSNCVANGIPAVCVTSEAVRELMAAVNEAPRRMLCVDLTASAIHHGDRHVAFTLPDAARRELLDGSWDSTTTLLSVRDELLRLAARLPYFDNWHDHEG